MRPVNHPPVVLFLGNGRSYHTLDWFRSAQKLNPDNQPVLITDLIVGESFKKLITENDLVRKLLILDKFLFKKQCRLGDIWRNILKLLAFPIQIVKLRRILKTYENPIVHAHAMYYIALARFTADKYVATPQGSELLVRPYKSLAYRFFSDVALARASRITVDSSAMQKSLRNLFNLDAQVVQNGVDLDSIMSLRSTGITRNNLVSIRGFSSNYQIDLLLKAREKDAPDTPIHFCYPFVEAEYKDSLKNSIIDKDKDLGRLDRLDLYKLLLSAKLVISIPSSDSSPRSVYEAIFCNCIVAVTNGAWISQLPKCMFSRLIVVDPYSEFWLRDALAFANACADIPYVPSSQAIDLFDQKRSMQKFYEEIYPSFTSIGYS
ncbi:Glyco_trans_4-like_N domain-containing protein [Gammaproteobacteria bacterium]